MLGPSRSVLDLFAVPEVVEPLDGSQGGSVRAGDLVLSPGRDAATAAWSSPLVARLAVTLDERPRRRRRDLRIAVPVPARDGSWVVDGWGACRWEPGSTACRDLDVLRAAGWMLHAELAVALPERPPGLEQRDGRWARAERLAFGPVAYLPDTPLVRRVGAAVEPTDLGPDQLVHTDLAGNVLLDVDGAPVVIDLSLAWRPARWADAVCVLDATTWLDADPAALAEFGHGAARQAMLRALLFRVLSDPDDWPAPESSYAAALAAVGLA